jgi:hypothetical protein
MNISMHKAAKYRYFQNEYAYLSIFHKKVGSDLPILSTAGKTICQPVCASETIVFICTFCQKTVAFL